MYVILQMDFRSLNGVLYICVSLCDEIHFILRLKLLLTMKWHISSVRIRASKSIQDFSLSGKTYFKKGNPRQIHPLGEPMNTVLHMPVPDPRMTKQFLQKTSSMCVEFRDGQKSKKSKRRAKYIEKNSDSFMNSISKLPDDRWITRIGNWWKKDDPIQQRVIVSFFRIRKTKVNRWK